MTQPVPDSTYEYLQISSGRLFVQASSPSFRETWGIGNTNGGVVAPKPPPGPFLTFATNYVDGSSGATTGYDCALSVCLVFSHVIL
jgi:hypothetical protein